MGTDHQVGQSIHLAVLYAAIPPDADSGDEGPDDRDAGATRPYTGGSGLDATRDIKSHNQTPQTILGLETPPQGGEVDGGADGHSTVVAPITSRSAVADNTDEDEIAEVNQYNASHGDRTLCRPQGYGISYDPPIPRILSGKLLARVVRVEFDPAHFKSSVVEKALAAGVEVLLPEESRGNAYHLERQYERILRHAEYISRRRTALQAFEEEMDVSTAICLAEAAKRDPQYAALRRRLRQVDDRYKVKGDQSTQFGQLMDLLRGTGDTTETITGGSSNGGNGNHGDEQPHSTQHPGITGEDDEDDPESGGLRFGGDDEESE